LDSTNADAWMSLGRLHEEQGDLQLAVEAYDQACAFVDNGKNGCPSAGRIYLATGMYDLAAARYEMSLRQIGEGWLPGREGLVKALLASGRTQEAIPHLTVLAASGSAEARETLSQLGVSK
jgi:tetratricopeptide (TPR) repeat protein